MKLESKKYRGDVSDLYIAKFPANKFENVDQIDYFLGKYATRVTPE